MGLFSKIAKAVGGAVVKSVGGLAIDAIGELLSCKRSETVDVMSQITNQVTSIGDSAIAPMQGMVNEVMSGVWTGHGADAFVDEVTRELIQSASTVVGQIGGFNGNISQALDTITNADQVVRNKVEGFASDILATIF